MDIVSVIIVNWNGRKFLPECLEGLRRQVFRHFTVIFADNGSSDGSIDFVKRNYPEVEIIALPGNVGFSAANNIALETVETEYAALLNNDAAPDYMWLKNTVEALEAHPEAGSAASKMLFYDDSKVIDRAGDSYTRAGAGFLRGRGMPADNYDKQEWIFGACAGAALYRTQMLRNTGLFDEDFFLVYEDVDLSFRAQLKGWKCVYVPEAVVYHRAGGSIVFDSPASVYYSQRNLEWVYVKNMPSGLILRTILPHIIYDLAAFLYFVTRGRGRDFIRAKRDALKGLKKALQKRSQIQQSKMVDDGYLLELLDKEWLFPRLTRRLRKN